MLKSADNEETKRQPTSKVIKNGNTAVELAESGKRWATHEGQYVTLGKIVDIEAAKIIGA